MSQNDRPEAPSPATAANGSAAAKAENPPARALVSSSLRLRLNPNKEHKAEEYEDLQLEYCPAVFTALERYLPPNMLNVRREHKAKFMHDILAKYMPRAEQTRIQKLRAYRLRIIANYRPRFRELYTLNPTAFFVPAFLNAINENTEQSFRRIISEPSPGIFIFQMLQPRICELFLSEIENVEKFVAETKFRIMRPNIMNKYGVVLDDFGFGPMLEKLMEGFIRPLSRVLFPEIGSSLDSHHGFVVEYGKDKAVDMGFHVDDSEVTLNVCLGKEFSGGELYFQGTRCEKHVNTSTYTEEYFDYSHKPGRAVLHRGRHRRGAKATTSGHRVNLLLWCRSSVFREVKRYQTDCSSWCGECSKVKKESQCSRITSTKSALLAKEGESTSK
ncbi:hypothetical protein HN51_070767 [Arachis hypogaea]|uniref:uncharacterized PKHD-type hydroxylase At1g22950 n=1 Tax=Arachis ipaensis TaxID=130454 RepID=UPI0007AFBEF3|nr:uncharacterized PKHD-type hydroxylase At1g22950 [Arachis ipaensis]XP_025655832.1 uncharacterized PKHD-type hydroxylase At1g22950 isoform X1 [Arachis hypogaea]QHO13209.1 putative PKHD-type hydroxylase [Arachis hypogaea]